MPNCVAISSDDKLIAIAHYFSTIVEVHDLESAEVSYYDHAGGQRVTKEAAVNEVKKNIRHEMEACFVAWQGRKYLITIGEDSSTLVAWDMQNQTIAFKQSCPTHGYHQLISMENEATLVGVSPSEITFWRVPDLQCIGAIPVESAAPKWACYIKNRGELAVGYGAVFHLLRNDAGLVKIYDRFGQQKNVFRADDRNVHFLDWSDEENLLFILTDKKIQVCSIR
jgi:hypothetical protein